MIFLTVGAQMPFDRLVMSVDAWAAARGRCDVRAQIGPTQLEPAHLQVEPFLSPAQFRERVSEASAVVAHAGMGTILTALELGKPILVFPRLARLHETRNDHQVATARRLVEQRRVRAAYDAKELHAELDGLLDAPAPERIGGTASPELLRRIRDYALG